MRKIFSSILALAMTLSLFTFTAKANSEVAYHISYEPISVASNDMSKLAVGDTFWAVVTLEGATGIFGGGITLTWNSDNLTTINSSGEAKTGFSAVTDQRITKTILVDGYDVDAGEMTQVAAFKQPTAKVSTGTLEYEYAADMIYDESEEGDFYDYPVSGDVVIFKVRFKVLTASDFDLATSVSTLRQTKADSLKTIDANFDALGFAGSEPVVEVDVTTEDVTYVAKATNVTGWTGVQFDFATTDSRATKVAEPVKVAFGTAFEAAEAVTVGIKVNGVVTKIVTTTDGEVTNTEDVTFTVTPSLYK